MKIHVSAVLTGKGKEKEDRRRRKGVKVGWEENKRKEERKGERKGEEETKKN